MPTFRLLVPSLALSLLAVLPARAAVEDDDDWKMLGGALSILQQIVQVAAQSTDPEAARKKVDAMIAGENPEANRMAARLMDDVLAEVPNEHRGTFESIARDLLVIARREQAKAVALPATASPALSSPEAALQARKELHAMGLRYWDEQQFLEAVRRGDRLAIDLFLAARGLESKSPLPAR
jgi:hypothetical protein